jgi:hypothetical protein
VTCVVLPRQDTGERCTNDCAVGAITASIGGIGATSIQYIQQGNYWLYWEAGACTAVGAKALVVQISGADVASTPATITIATGDALLSNTLIYDNPALGGIVGTEISFSLQLRDRYGNLVSLLPDDAVSFHVIALCAGLSLAGTPQ